MVFNISNVHPPISDNPEEVQRLRQAPIDSARTTTRFSEPDPTKELAFGKLANDVAHIIR